MLFEILGRVEHRAGFEQGDIDAQIREDLHGRSAAGTRSDHDYVVYGAAAINLHMPLSYQTRIMEPCIITIQRRRSRS